MLKKRTHLFLALCLISLVVANRAIAQNSIIIVKTINNSEAGQIVSGVEQTCVDDRYIITEIDMNGQPRRMAAVASEIADSIAENPPKAILTIGDPATEIAKNAVNDVPIFFTMINHPAEKGFSGKGIAGISLNIPIEIQLNQIRTLLPIAKTLGIVYNQEDRKYLSGLQQRARYIGAELVLLKVSSVSNFAQVIEKSRGPIDALIFLPDTQVINKDSFESIIAMTIEKKFPTLVYSDFLVRQGFLMSLSPDYVAIGKQAGNRLCSNTAVGESIIAPDSTKLSINRNTASLIGVNISAAVTANATIYDQ